MLTFEPIAYALELKEWGVVFVLLLAVAVAMLIWSRTGSTHMLMSRLWRITFGKADCPEASIRKILDAETAVCQFQVHTNIRARTVAHVEKISKWGLLYDVPLQWIGAAKEYFDLDLPGLNSRKNIPDPWVVKLSKLALWLAAPVAVGCTALTVYDKGIFVFKSTGRWFTLDDRRASPVAVGEGFALSHCTEDRKKLARISGFSDAEIAGLCNADGFERQSAVNAALFVQRGYFGLLLPFAAYISFDLWRFRRRATAAIAIRKRLADHAMEEARVCIDTSADRPRTVEAATRDATTEAP
ncbi:DUF6216 family protein [Pseudoduganella plicata]|uniref:Uncharacterized protein n=1 Tax=Pseudoduganella plicata TaxID=321984 RepID=A0A4P7BMS9_9BURK|nr:DUF6216 family protein [Pseudoduganella plicata]QBQ39065.1 hypothetical protein E1742_25140 [Pseudoduganella plicata]GGY86906.1 hypothetical protein GCM10007388_20270 [Pseudoduganella plicata]